MKLLKWNATREEHRLINLIADRALARFKEIGVGDNISKMDIQMDIEATHSNGCRLDLHRLLDAPNFDFMHDICGIYRHLNRQTGELENCFVPRCAARELANV